MLVNNAGGILGGRTLSRNGHKLIAPFLPTHRLHTDAPAVVKHLERRLPHVGRIDLDDLDGAHRP